MSSKHTGRRCGIVTALGLLTLLTIPASAQNGTATLRADLSGPGRAVSPSLYGIFFEEINHAGEGGLYAEMLRNRDFEAADPMDGWTLDVPTDAVAQVAPDTTNPLNAQNPHALRVTVDKAGENGVGISNGGYWGIPAREGEALKLTFYARQQNAGSGLLVQLVGASGQIYAQAAAHNGKGKMSTAWEKYALTLRPDRDDAQARLTFRFLTPGTYWIDAASLFPVATYKHRKNGLRPDLARRVADLKPGFVRFPGGCYVEGNVLANRFQWKNTVGGIETRPGHLNDNWNYHSTDGLGYHEYLQLCEDTHAAPLFVVNCGMSHKEQVPLDQLQPYIQDALDAIEYANGPITSTWGALRAKNGHPKPFQLKYIEIGNENGLFGGTGDDAFGGTKQQYADRYIRFYDAIKQRYPDLVTIADNTIPHPIETLDEHYYQSAEWFRAHADQYDTYDRKGPKIYVGEYAVTQGCGQGNLRAALGEAAFMTGLERNGDIVTMSSYAPLFVNVNDRLWNPDAICFNNTANYGTPSYWVQQLFAANRGDRSFPVTISASASQSAVTGGIGLGTWKTQAEFRNVQVTDVAGKTLLTSDFADPKQWNAQGGQWSRQDGIYRQNALDENLRTTAGEANWGDYTLTLQARRTGGSEGFLILFHARDAKNWYWWNVGGWNNTQHAVEKTENGNGMRIGPFVPGSVENNRWYDVKIELRGNTIRCFLDGKLIEEVEDKPLPPLNAVVSQSAKTGDILCKIVNNGAEARMTDIALDGVGGLRPNGEQIVLHSDSLDDENSLAQPDKITPQVSRLTGVKPHFSVAVAPYSLTILRLKPTGKPK